MDLLDDPFDDPSADSRVVLDGLGRACLWPAWCPVPHGWATVLCPAPHAEALAFLRQHDDAAFSHC